MIEISRLSNLNKLTTETLARKSQNTPDIIRSMSGRPTGSRNLSSPIKISRQSVLLFDWPHYFFLEQHVPYIEKYQNFHHRDLENWGTCFTPTSHVLQMILLSCDILTDHVLLAALHSTLNSFQWRKLGWKSGEPPYVPNLWGEFSH